MKLKNLFPQRKRVIQQFGEAKLVKLPNQRQDQHGKWVELET